MTRTAKIAQIIEQRRPLANRIETATQNLTFLNEALHHLEEQRHLLLEQIDEPNVINTLQSLNIASFSGMIAKELEALKKLQSRFSRNSLNIGVVGRARQGKSRLLQSLTGLTSAEIPDGSTQHCTGVRSTLYHVPNSETYAEVKFHSEASFLKEVIAPYYRKLELGIIPLTLKEFAHQPLPSLPPQLSQSDEPKEMTQAKYEHLKRYHTHFNQYHHLLKITSPQQIPRQNIREYVAQDNAEGQQVFFNYLAVKEVKITCTFPNNDVSQIALVDMPGLGDTGIGDAERMIEILGQDVDFVLFVKLPKSLGDFWADVDVQLYGLAAKSLVDLPINLWSFMILNKTSATSPNGDNLRNCQSLAETMAGKYINVAQTIIADCSNPEEVNHQILDRVLDYLSHQIKTLDQQYALACQERLSILQNNINTELQTALTTLKNSVNQDKISKIFLPKFDQFWQDITNGLKTLVEDLRKNRDEVDIDFKEQVETAIKTCKQDHGIPTIEKIEILNNQEQGYGIVYEKYLNEVRANLSKHFLSLDDGLKRSLNRVKSQVADTLINLENGGLGGLTDARGVEFIQALADIIPESEAQLKAGFQLLADFELSYRGFVQHRIRQHLDGLTPNEPTTKKLGKTPDAEQVLNCLKTAHAEAVYKCDNALAELFCEPSQAAFAIVEEFLDRILRAAGVKNEWYYFVEMHQQEIWPLEFKEFSDRTRLKTQWSQILEQAQNANQPQNLQFLN